MTANRVIRASDQDRDSAAELLSEAYAVGRLTREELDDRATAAYSAKTQGELRDLTADLPRPVARTGLPSETVALPPMRPRADRRQAGEMIWILEFALAAGLAGLVIPPAVWVATVLIPITLLLLPPALGARRACRGLNHPPFGIKILISLGEHRGSRGCVALDDVAGDVCLAFG
jgi:hypothetical protein